MNPDEKRTLLLVDDEPIIGMIVEKQFSEDHQVTIKQNGVEALSHIMKGEIPDVIVIDLNMPKMGGMEFLGEIRKFHYLEKIPVIVLSGEDSVNARIEAFNAGADDFLIKPFNPKELRVRIKRFFDRYKFHEA
ncbi:MAG: response regulator transcription factor [Nitritalea sp.]